MDKFSSKSMKSMTYWFISSCPASSIFTAGVLLSGWSQNSSKHQLAQYFLSLKIIICSSSDRSKLFVKPQTLNEFTIILEMLSHALTIQPTITSKGADLWLLAALYSCFPASNQSWYDFAQLALKRLFQQTSGAWMKPVQPPGMTAWSTFNFLRESFVSLPTWHLKLSHTSNLCGVNITGLRQSSVIAWLIQCVPWNTNIALLPNFLPTPAQVVSLVKECVALTWYHHPF